MEKNNKKEILSEIGELLKVLPESVQPIAFEKLYKDYFPDENKSKKNKPKTLKKKSINRNETSEKEPNTKLKKSNRKLKAENYSLDKDLNLRGGTKIPSFKDYVKQKNPKSSADFTAVSVYYLSELMGLDSVNYSQLYTCYKEINRKPPNSFKQTVLNAKSREGYIDFNEDGNLVIPLRGKNYVEHDLPKNEE